MHGETMKPGKIIFYSDFTLTCVMHISYSFSFRQL